MFVSVPNTIINKKSIVFLTSLFASISFYILQGNFKVAVAVSLVTALWLWVWNRSISFSLFLLLLISAQHYLPAKYYLFQYASPVEYNFELLRDGIVENFSFTLSDFYATALWLILIRMLLGKILKVLGVTQTKDKPSKGKNLLARASFTSWGVYLILLFYSSFYQSFYPAFSLAYSFQTAKMFIVAWFLLHFLNRPEFKKSIYFILTGTLLFQGLLGLTQIVSASTGKTEALAASYVVVEEDILFSRVKGLSGHANQHGFYILLFVVLLTPFLLKRRSRLFSSVVLLVSVTNIILTQSRTTWLSAIICLTVVALVHRKKIEGAIKKRIKEPLVKTFLMLVIVIGFVVISPRIYLSSFFFSLEGGGTLRLKMIEDSLDALWTSPLFGFGAGTTVRTMLSIMSEGYIRTFPYPVHFGYIHLALESGIFSVLAIFFPFYLLLRGFASDNINKKRKKQMLPIVLSITCLLIQYVFQPVIMRIEYFFWGLILGFGLYTASGGLHQKDI